LMNAMRPMTSIDVCAEFGIECDRSFQQVRRDRLVLEAADADERFLDGRQIVPVLIKSSANSFEITQRRKEFECVRGSSPLRRNSCSSPLARDSMRLSHTVGITTAPASISSSAHAARVNHRSLSGSEASP
jgi:hypothetical protein